MSRQFAFLIGFLAMLGIGELFYLGNLSTEVLHRAPWMDTMNMVSQYVAPIFLLPCVAWAIKRWGFGGGLVLMIISNTGVFVPLLFSETSIALAVFSLSSYALRCTVPDLFLYSFIIEEFGMDNFGKIAGAAALIIGTFVQFNLVLNAWANKSGFFVPNLLLTLVAYLFLPLCTAKGQALISPVTQTAIVKEKAQRAKSAPAAPGSWSRKKSQNHHSSAAAGGGSSRPAALSLHTLNLKDEESDVTSARRMPLIV